MRSDWTEAILARLDLAARRISQFRRSRQGVADPIGSRLRLTVVVSVVTGLLAIAIVAAFTGPAIRDNPFGGLITAAVNGSGLDPHAAAGTVELQGGETPAPLPGKAPPSTPAPEPATTPFGSSPGGGVPGADPPAPQDGQAQADGGPGSVTEISEPTAAPTGSTGGGAVTPPPPGSSTPTSGPDPTQTASPDQPSPTQEPSDPTPDPTDSPTPPPDPTPPPPEPSASPTPSPSAAPACSDGIDNDGDGLVDLLDVLGCLGPFDDDESNLIL